MKEEEKIENARVKRRNPATEEKIMLNIFKYNTIPKETLHFLRFSKLMYYQMGVHPPPIQKLSHGDLIHQKSPCNGVKSPRVVVRLQVFWTSCISSSAEAPATWELSEHDAAVNQCRWLKMDEMAHRQVGPILAHSQTLPLSQHIA